MTTQHDTTVKTVTEQRTCSTCGGVQTVTGTGRPGETVPMAGSCIDGHVIYTTGVIR